MLYLCFSDHNRKSMYPEINTSDTCRQDLDQSEKSDKDITRKLSDETKKVKRKDDTEDRGDLSMPVYLRSFPHWEHISSIKFYMGSSLT